MVPSGSSLTTANNLPPWPPKLWEDIQRVKVDLERGDKSSVLCALETAGVGSVRQTKFCKLIVIQMGYSCSLQTGQEKVVTKGSSHVSCTIETVNLSLKYDVAIIDEIQMIGNEDRGSAWTQALLGLDAKEIHICGDSRALDYISQLARLTNDTVSFTYRR